LKNIVAHVAVIGRIQLIPGILPVSLTPEMTLHVSHSFPPFIENSSPQIKVDTTDCTVFQVEFPEDLVVSLDETGVALKLLEQSLFSISEASIWMKANDVIGELTSYIRQVGVSDVKCFFAENGVDAIVYVSPIFSMDRVSAGLLSGFLPNLVVRNGPATTPVPEITKRVLSSLDLVNLGFYTESFINLFALVDDLTQEILKLGLEKIGLDKKAQKNFLRSIKEDRLGIYLGSLSKMCGWASLAEADKDLYDRIMTVNTARNNTMHGPLRLTSDLACRYLDVLMETIEWLRKNPFGYIIPEFPNSQLITPKFMKFSLPR
jgi:hypothetical protein